MARRPEIKSQWVHLSDRAWPSSSPSRSTFVREHTVRLRDFNRRAKQSATRGSRKQWYELKHKLLSKLIETRPELLIVAYHRHKGYTTVLIGFDRRASWHCPFVALTTAAKVAVVHSLGSVSTFESRHAS